MMSKGFITTSNLARDLGSDLIETELHITDTLADKATANDEGIIIEIYIVESGQQLNFGLEEAKALVEGMQEIISRY